MKVRTKAGTFAIALGLALVAPLCAQTPTTSQDAKKDMNAQKQDPLMMQESADEPGREEGHERAEAGSADDAGVRGRARTRRRT